jgi:hypothetical protein
VGVVVACGGPVWTQGPAGEEYRLKAAFVFRFPQFVDWPASALAGRDALQICVYRPNPFGVALQELTAGETVNGRLLETRDVSQSDGLDGCHVLFIPAAADPELPEVLTRTARHPVLTVGETPRFLEQGGIINLRIVENRLRFEVNAQAATSSGLRLSSQLLRLAIGIRGTAS